MYEYRLCLYVCNLDVALFHSWLQGVTSKSVKTSENSLLNPGGYFPKHCRQGDIRPGKGVNNCREDDCRGEGGGVLYGRGERDETGLVQAVCWRLWDAKDSCSCASLCEGWGRVVEGRGYGDHKKGVGVADNVNDGIADSVFDRDCEPRRRKQLACNYAASRCSTGGVVQPIAEGEITFLSIVFSIRPQRRQTLTSSRVLARSSNNDSKSVQHIS